MRILSRLADWLRHTRPRDRALTVAALAVCAGVAIAAAAGNSGHLKAHRTVAQVQPTASTESSPTIDSTTDVVRHKPAKKTRKHKHKKAKHHHAKKHKKAKKRSSSHSSSHGSVTVSLKHKGGRHNTPQGTLASNTSPVVVGSDVWSRDSTNRFFKQYSVDAAVADGSAAAGAVVDWINAHGGIAGHRLTLRERSFDFYGSPVSTQDNATCATWSSGDVPLVDIEAHASTDILIPCLRKHGIATLVNTVVPPASTDYASNPASLFAPGSPALDNVMTAYVSGLVNAGFFSGKAKIGLLLSTNLPQLGSAAEALKRAITAAGLKAAETAKISLEDPASFFSTEASAVLHFRLAKVDHIIALDQDGLTLGQFMRGAEAEEYRPVYGVSSTSAPAFLAGDASPKQLRRAIGVGWSPLLDVQSSDDPGGGPTRTTCASIFGAAGVSVGGRTPFGQYAAYQACDSLMAMRAAHAVSPATLLSGMNGLGSRWQSGLALSTYLGPGQHHGAAGWRLLRYADGCRCFRYEGPTHGM